MLLVGAATLRAATLGHRPPWATGHPGPPATPGILHPPRTSAPPLVLQDDSTWVCSVCVIDRVAELTWSRS